MIGHPALVMALALQVSVAATSPQDVDSNGAVSRQHRGNGEMSIHVKIGDRILTATLLESAAARDFSRLLPLTLTMEDLFGREKYGHLPRAISEDGQRSRTYEVGQIVYWSPGPDVAIYYRQDGQSIPAPGIVVLGKVEGDLHVLATGGAVKVTFERAQ